MQQEPHSAGSSNGNGACADAHIDWPTVWKRHSRWVQTVLAARIGDPDVAEDAFQEMALSISRNPQSWPDPEKVAPWLYRVAIRRVQMYRRQSKLGKNQIQVVELDELAELESSQQPLDWVVANEATSQLRDAMDKLAAQDREMLMLKHGLNWSYREIAEHLGITQDKVIYRLGRARKRIRQVLSCQTMQPRTASQSE